MSVKGCLLPRRAGRGRHELDLLVVHGQQGQGVGHSAVHAGEGDGPAAAYEVDGEVESGQAVHSEPLHHPGGQGVRKHGGQVLGPLRRGCTMGFHADGVDHGVRSAAVGQCPHLVDDVRAVRVEVEGVDAMVGGAAEPFGDEVDADDEACSAVCGDAGGHVSDGPETEYGDGAAGWDRGVLDGLPGGGQDVGEVDEAVVGAVVRYGDGKGVAEGDAEVLGLAAGDPSIELGVAEEGCAAAMLADLCGLALGVQAMGAHVARAAGDVERDDDPFAGPHAGDVRADFLHDAHGLVAEDVAGVEEGAEEFVEVQVGSAQAGRGDLHDHVRGVFDHGVGHGVDAYVAFAVPGQGLHGDSGVDSPRQCAVRGGGQQVLAGPCRWWRSENPWQGHAKSVRPG